MYHIVLDLFKVKCIDILMNPLLLEKYLTWIVDVLELTSYTKPILTPFPLGNGLNAYTGMLVLSESLISFHTYPSEQVIYIDLFSCKAFDHDKFQKFSCAFFEAGRFEMQRVNRSDP